MNYTPLNNLQQPKYTNFSENGKVDLNNYVQDGNQVIPPPDLSDYEYLRITAEKEIPINRPVITIGSKGVAARRNITGISAQYKAGKTALTSVILAGAISPTGEVDGFNDLHVEPNPEGKAVVDIDTEQAEDDQQYKVKTILKRAGIIKTPDYYFSANFRLLSLEDYRKKLTPLCEAACRKFGGIHLISIDGGADFLHSVNDEAESALIREYFVHLSITYDCPVLIVIHQNPGSGKERGHFGSEIQRKCYGLISITKEGDISTAQVKAGRKAGTTDTPLISYKYNEVKGYHTEVNPPDEDSERAKLKREKHKKIADKVFTGQTSFSHKDAVSQIMDKADREISTAKKMLENMCWWGYVVKGKDGLYRKNINSGQGQFGSNLGQT